MIIIVNGLPRSGSTLLYNIVCGVLSRQNTSVRILGYMSMSDIDANETMIRKYIKSEEILIFKTHDYPDALLNDQSAKRYVKHLYTFRNIREIARSMRRVWSFSDTQIENSISQHFKVYQKARKDDVSHLVDFQKLIRREHEISLLLSNVTCSEITDESFQDILDDVTENTQTDSYNDVNANKEVSKLILAFGAAFGLSKILRVVLPFELFSWLRNHLYGINNRTLIHPRHISVNSNSTLIEIDDDFLNELELMYPIRAENQFD